MDSGNLESTQDMPNIIASKIAKEHAMDWVVRSFSVTPITNLQVSPLGVVPQKTPGKYQLIHHLSYPKVSLATILRSVKIYQISYYL